MRTILVTLGAALVAASGCSEPLQLRAVEPRVDPVKWRAERARTRATLAEHDSHVVIVALDGVRWKEVFRGTDPELARAQHFAPSELARARDLMPNLHHIIENRGAVVGSEGRGAPILASGPNFVSTPGYMEMLTGKRPVSCGDNHCPRIAEPTLVDEFTTLPGVKAEDVAVIASWEGIGKAASFDPTRIAMSVGRTQGATRHLFAYDDEAARLLREGSTSGPAPGHDDFRRDRATAKIALRYLSHRRPRFMFLGLGEPDEFAHQGNYRGYLRALRSADQLIGEMVATLDELAQGGSSTALFITTDHGRADSFTDHGAGSPESARVWLVATGTAISARGRVAAPVERHLADIAPTIRHLEKMPADGSGRRGHVLEELLATDEARARVVLAP